MRRSPLVAGLVWVVCTALTTAVSWAGVRAVDRAVEGIPVPVIPSAQVVAGPALTSGAGSDAVPRSSFPGSGGGAAIGASNLAASGAGSSSPDRTGGGSAAATGSKSADSKGSSRSSSGATGTSGATDGQHQTNSGGDGASRSSTSTATYSTPGGSATVACSGDSISLQSVTPSDGYQLDVADSGPTRVDVYFAGGGSQFHIGARCVSGQAERVDSPDQGSTSPSGAPTSGSQPDGGSTGS